MNVTAFIADRLTEIEHTAAEASQNPGSVWESVVNEAHPGIYYSEVWCGDDAFARVDYEDVAEHIALHDPALTLRECAALRQVLGYATWAQKIFDQDQAGGVLPPAGEPHEVSDRGYRMGQAHAYQAVLRSLAGIWIGHRDFLPEWAVGAEVPGV